jgi:acetyl-CoA synthetase (ADP-forming)
MIESLPGSEILAGVRNRPGIDKGALRDVIARVAWLIETFDEIDQIDLNPVSVFFNGAVVLDARLYLRELS